jgi:FixJ family two-component response regulator
MGLSTADILPVAGVDGTAATQRESFEGLHDHRDRPKLAPGGVAVANNPTGEHPAKPERGIVFVVDDDPSMRAALQSLLASVGHEVRLFASAAEFMQAARVDRAGCLLLDVRLPGMSGLAFQQELTNAGVALPVIFITGHGDVPMSVRAMKAGAVEFLTKPFDDQVLLDAVHAALERDRARRREAEGLASLRDRYAELTERERQVMGHVVAGQVNKRIADALGLSVVTIKVHRGQVMKKMRASSVADLVRMADRLGVHGADPHPIPRSR